MKYHQGNDRNGVEAYAQLFYGTLSGDKSLLVHVDVTIGLMGLLGIKLSGDKSLLVHVDVTIGLMGLLGIKLSGDKSLLVHVDETVTTWEVVEKTLNRGETLPYEQNTMPKSGLAPYLGSANMKARNTNILGTTILVSVQFCKEIA